MCPRRFKADAQVYESPDDAKEAITHLNGFNFSGRYIVGKLTPTVRSDSASASRRAARKMNELTYSSIPPSIKSTGFGSCESRD
jgi:hypothetical protein